MKTDGAIQAQFVSNEPRIIDLDAISTVIMK